MLLTFSFKRILDSSVKKVREEAFYMKRAIDSNDLKLTIDHAIEMLRELKSNTLNPKTYYELYMKVRININISCIRKNIIAF